MQSKQVRFVLGGNYYPVQTQLQLLVLELVLA